MHKFLAILGVLVLVGAGCSTEPSKPTTREMPPSAQDEASIDKKTTSDNQPSEGSGIQAKATIKEEGEVSTIKTEGGAALTVETDSEEDGITDITLGAPVAQTVNMQSDNFSFSPKTITAKAGDRVRIVFSMNSGFHTIVIDEIGLKATVAQGESITFTAPSKPGTYAFYCDVGSHRANGMEGSLIIK